MCREYSMCSKKCCIQLQAFFLYQKVVYVRHTYVTLYYIAPHLAKLCTIQKTYKYRVSIKPSPDPPGLIKEEEKTHTHAET